MVENHVARHWLYRLAYFGLAGTIVFFHILPVQIGPAGYPGPDLLICITFAWVLRRPSYVPPLLIAGVFLVTDMLFLRAPGLWTALVVLGAEFLRGREAISREMPFPVEWSMVSAVLIAMTVAERLILSVFMIDQAGFGVTALQLVATILVYPLVVVLSRTAFGVRRPAPGEIDSAGRPL